MQCVLEIRAFATGGLAGLEVLNRVYPQIFKHYGIHADNAELKTRILTAAGVYFDDEENKIKGF